MQLVLMSLIDEEGKQAEMHGVVMSLDEEHHQQERAETAYALGTKKEADWPPYGWQGKVR